MIADAMAKVITDEPLVLAEASNGCVFTDGESFTTAIAFAPGEDRSAWREVAEEVAEKMQAHEHEAARNEDEVNDEETNNEFLKGEQNNED